QEGVDRADAVEEVFRGFGIGGRRGAITHGPGPSQGERHASPYDTAAGRRGHEYFGEIRGTGAGRGPPRREKPCSQRGGRGGEGGGGRGAVVAEDGAGRPLAAVGVHQPQGSALRSLA